MSVNLYSLQGLYGHALGYVGRFAEGEQVCEAAVSLAKKTNNLYLIGYAEYLYGCMLFCKGDGKNSLNHIESSIGYLEKAHAVFNLPIVWFFLGAGYFLLGDLNTALKYIEKGHKMHLDVGLRYFLGGYHLGLSMIHFYLGNLSEAKVQAEQALKLSQTNHEKYLEGISWIQLGKVLGKMEGSQFHKAEEHILQGMNILEELETKPAYAQGYLSLGQLYADAGQREKAFENLKKAEAMFQKMGMDYYMARTKKLMGTL
jgi:tetratricopeptide (TPR) repeat protein